MRIEQVLMNSMAKSRSETLSRTVTADVTEAEFPGHEFAVDGEGGSGQGSGAKGEDVNSSKTILETGAITPEHFEVGQQVVGEKDRLSRLQMGVAGHNYGQMGCGLINKGLTPVGVVG